ncbi:hypothetical protein DERP_002552 [Dermatophagoides pteronyssinus]|uniref:COMM domain-containing protein 3 n=1 Tax=Dermatophagoides pteronyssinus TaxID=6956 RepID=A0ABQ8JI20_DERPT|nr:hypothetical protein DERP_002552 [Dermatophagoides pteronyssinus]
MDISSDILSTLSLINSNDITENDLLTIFDQCNKIIQNNTDHSTDKIDSIKIKILIFAINSLMLEACKCQINYQTLIRSLQDSGLDCSTQKFELFKNFLEKSMKKLYHNINKLELSSSEIHFKDIEWSQILDLKSSNAENIRRKNYLIDIIGSKPANNNDDHHNQQPNSTTESIMFTEQGLQDFYVTIRDCIKNIEHYI